jgi:hypothetical protein
MRIDFIKKFILPPGPVLSLTLIGLLLLGTILYYRAIRIQRFLEPAVAISQARIEFTQHIKNLFLKEFGAEAVKGVRFTSNSILVDKSLVYVDAHHMEGSEVLKRLGRVFLSALKDDHIRAHTELIIVGTRLPISQDLKLNKERRHDMLYSSELVLNALYKAEPALERNYSAYFAITVFQVDGTEKETNWIEFRIIPTEQLHIEVLRRLGKYAQ